MYCLRQNIKTPGFYNIKLLSKVKYQLAKPKAPRKYVKQSVEEKAQFDLIEFTQDLQYLIIENLSKKGIFLIK